MRNQVAWLYAALGEHRLIEGSAGNVSARVAEGMLITPSGGDPAAMADADVVTVGLDGTVADGGTPSSEWAMHAAAYRVCPQAKFVVHTHSDACTALACLGEPLPAFHYMILQFGGADVRCAPYVTFGTHALADLAAEALRDRSACLLANHGAIVAAPSAKTALDRMVLLETLCRQYLMARSVGQPRLLSADELAGAAERFKTYGPRKVHAPPS